MKCYWIFYCEVEDFFNFAFFVFLYDLFTNKARELEVAMSNPIVESFPIFFSVG